MPVVVKSKPATASKPNATAVRTFCSAMVSSTERRAFMCYGLGAANTGADPFTPSWELNGGYWQWGRKEMAAAGPSGSGSWQANDAAVAGWNSEDAPDGAWRDGKKKLNDPCPEGYRFPTKAEWEGVLNNNSVSNVGTWERSATNYSNWKNIGGKLFLPAAGYRDLSDGALCYRVDDGYYWSSTEYDSANAWYLGFVSGNTDTGNFDRSNGLSVRCIEE